ncbi:TlpA family protein disulfide reductase [Streptomyces sp. NPDC087218]|uniref:TlpA family protein disulfide reductase n=1 Tax=Streptomyces sp. NPDC087218 TaxID=3365769 RepID=UPI0037F4AE55
MKHPFVPLLAAVVCAVAVIGMIVSGGDPGTPRGFHRHKDGTLTIDPRHRPDAPSFMGTGVDGRPMSLSDHAGKTVVINAWASGCGPCRKQVSMLERYRKKAEGQGVVVLGLNRDSSPSVARAFVEGHDMSYPSLLDPAGKHLLTLPKGLLSTQGVPVTLVIDPRGRIASTASEAIGEERLADLVAAAVRVSSPSPSVSPSVSSSAG